MKKQQKLTDTLIESVPVGIIMLDEDGRLSIMNDNAKNILLQIDVDVQVIIEKNLPFEIIKKTYEPIYKVEHTIEKEGIETIFITVNGVPLFNHKGEFIGAVFSIIDNLSVESISRSFHHLEHKETLCTKEHSSLLNLGLLDITSNLQSYASDLSFFTQALAAFEGDSTQKEQLQENINTKIQEITTIITSNINYYKELFVSEKTAFIPLFKRYVKILQQTFVEEKFRFEDRLDTKLLLECAPREASLFLLEFFSKLIILLKNNLQDSEVVVAISYERQSNSIVILLEGAKLKEKMLQELQASMQNVHYKESIQKLEYFCVQDLYKSSVCI